MLQHIDLVIISMLYTTDVNLLEVNTLALVALVLTKVDKINGNQYL